MWILLNGTKIIIIKILKFCILKNFPLLKHMANSEEVDVVIVGAGAAGITAARTLKDAGLSVVILEANNRYGGRIHSVNGPSNFQYPVEVGAMWMHSANYNPMYAEVTEPAGIVTQIFDHNDTKTWKDGVKLKKKEVNALVGRWSTAWANAENFAQTGRSDQEAFLLGGYVPDREVETLRMFADEQIYADNAERHDSLGWEDLTDPGTDSIVTEGYIKVLDYLLTKEPSALPDLRLKCKVKKIKYEIGDGRARIVYRDDNVDDDDLDCEDSPRKKIIARKGVIVTVSTGVLKARAIKFVPELPAAHLHSIDTRLFGVADKVALFFPKTAKPILKKLPANYLFRIGKDPNPRFNDGLIIFVNDQYVRGQPAMLSFYQGDFARNMELKSDAEIIALHMTALREFIPDLPDPIDHHITRWGSDPLFRGVYTDFALGSVPADFTQMEVPVGTAQNLHFAGEGVGMVLIGTVARAYSSAKAVAQKIIDAQ